MSPYKTHITFIIAHNLNYQLSIINYMSTPKSISVCAGGQNG